MLHLDFIMAKYDWVAKQLKECLVAEAIQYVKALCEKHIKEQVSSIGRVTLSDLLATKADFVAQ
ncbi:hypothetical protein ID1001_08480 [Helicobacter pylori]